MSRKYRILVHVGLPKTGTTSLQYNVLMPLHRKGAINFIGRLGVARDRFYHNPIGKILYAISDEVLTESNIKEMRISLNNILSAEKLNVWSDESLILTHDCRHLIRWENLRRLLKHYDTRLIITLRDPHTFIHSYYTELFRWHYQFNKELNTLENYVNRVIEEPNKDEFDILFYQRLEPLFDGLRVTYVHFEDMIAQKSHFIDTLSNLLCIERVLLENLLYSKVMNSRRTLNGVRYSQKTTLDQIYYRYISSTLVKFTIYRWLKSFSIFRDFQKVILHSISRVPVHPGSPHTINSSYELLVKMVKKSEGYEDFIQRINSRK